MKALVLTLFGYASLLVAMPAMARSTTRSTTTTVSSGGSGPVTSLHYAPNNNLVNGSYVPGTAYFNLADVSKLSELNSLPSDVMGLVWLGLCNGADDAFISAVQPFLGNPKLWGFYLMDEPNPFANGASRCPAANLKAESDWVHTHAPRIPTFVVLQNFNTSIAPTYANTYNPANSHVDLFGLDPYPCRTEINGCDYDMIGAAVQAAEAAGIPVEKIVPVYQAFGGPRDDGGGKYLLPTTGQEEQILAIWGPLVPYPVFDYAYSWGVQHRDQALEIAPELQAVFAAHNQ